MTLIVQCRHWNPSLLCLRKKYVSLIVQWFLDTDNFLQSLVTYLRQGNQYSTKVDVPVWMTTAQTAGVSVINEAD
jgi:hypothetical protein